MLREASFLIKPGPTARELQVFGVGNLYRTLGDPLSAVPPLIFPSVKFVLKVIENKVTLPNLSNPLIFLFGFVVFIFLYKECGPLILLLYFGIATSKLVMEEISVSCV